MSLRPVITDLIEYLQQQLQANGDIVVVPNDDAIQAPGDYVTLDRFFTEFETREAEEVAAGQSPAPRG